MYDKETPYYITYAGTQLDVADSDGDGIRDGADDQDHDDVPNVMECSRILASGLTRGPGRRRSTATTAARGRASCNPFNPCLPHIKSRTCKRIVPVGRRVGPVQPRGRVLLIRD